MIKIGTIKVSGPTEQDINDGIRGTVEGDIPGVYADWKTVLEEAGGELGVEYDILIKPTPIEKERDELRRAAKKKRSSYIPLSPWILPRRNND